MFHNNLCKGRMVIERLSAQYFVMHENLSLEIYERGSNRHKRQHMDMVTIMTWLK